MIFFVGEKTTKSVLLPLIP